MEDMNINLNMEDICSNCSMTEIIILLRKFQNSPKSVKITILYFLYFLNFVSIKICYMKVHFAIIED